MLTPLEQFNEEVMKEISYIYYSGSHTPEELKSFITQKLIEHKALILKMVREEIDAQFLNKASLIRDEEKGDKWLISKKDWNAITHYGNDYS